MEKQIELKIKELLLKNDSCALEIIYDNIGRNLYKYMLSILCSHTKAEEVMQNLFVAIAEKRNRLSRARNLTSYIFAMAKNQAMDFLRSEPKNEKNIEDYKNIITVRDNTTDKLNDEEIEKITNALFFLPLKQREVITMKFFQGMTFEDIAKALNISLNTAASRYRYGIEKLKGKLKELGNEI
ncbi:MAG: sigma-70 family RNA polymerase sigma factor [Candidatus Omnitrophica bacterium]|nr:sigma-70 family RNA polymerase sigma factor [Candidatus Omnitrophota bacterium]MBU1048025.1 sigma-70 family RNA polymerase sigma factor [Candidatus Omnitrophota bacterium]MBU1631264.1 sigma-70 family RNA polymerase sigma factor [Candidatus Omnitrophota bacterium]MBU1889395.1 sigma-70 family RNA polymerase sigma factor [Candidatus Omnitrophota bacterium]